VATRLFTLPVLKKNGPANAVLLNSNHPAANNNKRSVAFEYVGDAYTWTWPCSCQQIHQGSTKPCNSWLRIPFPLEKPFPNVSITRATLLIYIAINTIDLIRPQPHAEHVK